MVSDGFQARIGALNAGREWVQAVGERSQARPWPTPTWTELQVMLEGVCDPARFLALVRDFIVFDDDGSGKLVKKMAGYHQFHAVRVAVDETLRAAELQRERAGRGRRGGMAVRGGPEAGGSARGQAYWRRLAHPGIGQEPDNGLLRRGNRP